jgi:hypothetical protein
MISHEASSESVVTLRVAPSNTDGAVARLAQLDSAGKPPREPLLVAEVDGQPRAALSLSDGTVVADPFHRTAGLVALLRMRAELNGGAKRARRRRAGRWQAA